MVVVYTSRHGDGVVACVVAAHPRSPMPPAAGLRPLLLVGLVGVGLVSSPQRTPPPNVLGPTVACASTPAGLSGTCRVIVRIPGKDLLGLVDDVLYLGVVAIPGRGFHESGDLIRDSYRAHSVSKAKGLPGGVIGALDVTEGVAGSRQPRGSHRLATGKAVGVAGGGIS